jgi:hypothetical protein
MADLNVNNVPDPTEFRHAIYPYSAFWIPVSNNVW